MKDGFYGAGLASTCDERQGKPWYSSLTLAWVCPALVDMTGQDLEVNVTATDPAGAKKGFYRPLAAAAGVFSLKYWKT